VVVSRAGLTLLAVGALAVAGCGGSGKKKPKHHTPTVAGAAKAQRDILDRALSRKGNKARVKAVSCAKASAARTFTCNIRLSNGRRSRTQVFFAPTGNVRSHELQ
jgi:hypothetical protein